jgi:hypothetical protein
MVNYALEKEWKEFGRNLTSMEDETLPGSFLPMVVRMTRSKV